MTCSSLPLNARRVDSVAASMFTVVVSLEYYFLPTMMRNSETPLESARSALKSIYWYYQNDQYNYVDLIGLIILHMLGVYGFWVFPTIQVETLAWFWALVICSYVMMSVYVYK